MGMGEKPVSLLPPLNPALLSFVTADAKVVLNYFKPTHCYDFVLFIMSAYRILIITLFFDSFSVFFIATLLQFMIFSNYFSHILRKLYHQKLKGPINGSLMNYTAPQKLRYNLF